jgi:hypothetical protein
MFMDTSILYTNIIQKGYKNKNNFLKNFYRVGKNLEYPIQPSPIRKRKGNTRVKL